VVEEISERRKQYQHQHATLHRPRDLSEARATLQRWLDDLPFEVRSRRERGRSRARMIG
jgi:hypothetical protein